jgi:zinc transporter 7
VRAGVRAGGRALFGARTALLNLFADATHNFTDGLAIGVAFGRQEHELATTLAVLLHELPHEVGDVSILIAAGYRPTQAVKMQFCTALGAMAGTIVGLLTGTYFAAASQVQFALHIRC